MSVEAAIQLLCEQSFIVLYGHEDKKHYQILSRLIGVQLAQKQQIVLITNTPWYTPVEHIHGESDLEYLHIVKPKSFLEQHKLVEQLLKAPVNIICIDDLVYWYRNNEQISYKDLREHIQLLVKACDTGKKVYIMNQLYKNFETEEYKPYGAQVLRHYVHLEVCSYMVEEISYVDVQTSTSTLHMKYEEVIESPVWDKHTTLK